MNSFREQKIIKYQEVLSREDLVKIIFDCLPTNKSNIDFPMFISRIHI